MKISPVLNPIFIIFRLAENVSTEIDGEYFSNALDDLIKKLNKGNGEVIYTTSFWKNKTVSDAIRKKRERAGSSNSRT